MKGGNKSEKGGKRRINYIKIYLFYIFTAGFMNTEMDGWIHRLIHS